MNFMRWSGTRDSSMAKLLYHYWMCFLNILTIGCSVPPQKALVALGYRPTEQAGEALKLSQ